MSARRFARSLARLVRERAGWDRVSRSPSGETDALVRPEDVEAAYRLVLNRGPDPDGRKTYSAMIGSCTVSDLVGCLMSSDEFRRSPLYRVVERREHSDVSLLEVAGLRLFVSRDDPCNRSLWEEGCYEPHLTAAIASVLRPGMVVWNVGANVGFHAMCAARAVGASGRVVAVEALSENARLIQRSALANNFANVTVLPLAASDAWQICRYVRAQGTNGYIEPAFAATATSAANLADPLVQTARLDDLRRPGERVDVLVIDVEGAEGLALRGAERLLTEDRPVIFTEVSPGQLVRTSRMTAEQYFEMLADLGYAFDVVGFDGRTSPFGRDAAAAAGYAVAQPGSHIDVRCTPVAGGSTASPT